MSTLSTAFTICILSWPIAFWHLSDYLICQQPSDINQIIQFANRLLTSIRLFNLPTDFWHPSDYSTCQQTSDIHQIIQFANRLLTSIRLFNLPTDFWHQISSTCVQGILCHSYTCFHVSPNVSHICPPPPVAVLTYCQCVDFIIICFPLPPYTCYCRVQGILCHSWNKNNWSTVHLLY